MRPSNNSNGVSPYRVLAQYYNLAAKISYAGTLKIYRCKSVFIDHEIKRSVKFLSRSSVKKLFFLMPKEIKFMKFGCTWGMELSEERMCSI